MRKFQDGPDVDTKVLSRSSHQGPQKKKKQPRRQPPAATKAPGSSGDKPDKLRLTQWTGCIWVVHWKLCLHRMMQNLKETGSHSMASDHYPAVKPGSRASSASGTSPRSTAYPTTRALASTDQLMPPPPPPATPSACFTPQAAHE